MGFGWLEKKLNQRSGLLIFLKINLSGRAAGDVVTSTMRPRPAFQANRFSGFPWNPFLAYWSLAGCKNRDSPRVVGADVYGDHEPVCASELEGL
jgi:hypothetical protein